LVTGVWSYDHLDKLIFDQKFKDLRTGSVTFGKHALMIYLENSTHAEYDWHCRIDVPYAILEHTVPSFENGRTGSITLTLKSPPKIYNVIDTEDLHLYTGQAANVNNGQLLAMAKLSLGEPKRGPNPPKLERLCSLYRRLEKNTGLCMVYKLQFPSLQHVQQAWTFMKSFSVPEMYCWKTMVPHERTGTIENDFTELEQRLVHSPLSFAVQFQMQALVLEGTVTPTKMTQMVPWIVSMANRYGQASTASSVRLLGRQIPTPGPHVESSRFHVSTLRDLLAQGIKYSRESERSGLEKKRKQDDHVVLIYKATVTPTGK
jgi:hypothetical protein